MNPAVNLVLSAADDAAAPLQLAATARREGIRRAVEQALEGRVPAAFARAENLAPEPASSGIAALDELLGGGLPRGCLTEFCGHGTSGRTSVMLQAIAAATARQEACCLIDVSDAFDPLSGGAAGIELRRLLWVRCDDRVIESSHRAIGKTSSAKRKNFARLEQALRVADIILQGGGFGLLAIDMAGIAPAEARRVPLASWFRFRRAVERTPTVLLAICETPVAGTCASAVVNCRTAELPNCRIENLPTHARLLEQIEIVADALRLPGRKQPRAAARFAATAQWAAIA